MNEIAMGCVLVPGTGASLLRTRYTLLKLLSNPGTSVTQSPSAAPAGNSRTSPQQLALPKQGILQAKVNIPHNHQKFKSAGADS
jgi:hypothetical protein